MNRSFASPPKLEQFALFQPCLSTRRISFRIDRCWKFGAWSFTSPSPLHEVVFLRVSYHCTWFIDTGFMPTAIHPHSVAIKFTCLSNSRHRLYFDKTDEQKLLVLVVSNQINTAPIESEVLLSRVSSGSVFVIFACLRRWTSWIRGE